MFGDIKILLFLSAAMVVLSGATYGLGRLHGSEACDARHAEAAQADFMRRTEEGNVLSADLETDLAASRNFYSDLRKQVNYEISSNPIYASCIVPANGVFLVNSALKGSASR